MARPREFDTDVALGNIMRTLWSNGYAATSVEDLCASSGLSKSSLYMAFGDKHALLLRSLAHYIDARVCALREVLAGPGSIQDALRTLVEQIIDDVVAGPGRRGCFIGNCATEISRNDRRAMALVRGGMTATENVFKDALTRARSREEISVEADIDAMSRFLVAGFQGLRLVGKVNPDRTVLWDIASVMLQCVRSHGEEDREPRGGT